MKQTLFLLVLLFLLVSCSSSYSNKVSALSYGEVQTLTAVARENDKSSNVSTIPYDPLQKPVQNKPVQQSKPSEVITVDLYDEWTLQLPENPTTGYQWVVSQEGDGFIEILSTKYKTENVNKLGSSGTRTWNLKAVRPGVVTLLCLYTRPWEERGGHKETRTFRFVIR